MLQGVGQVAYGAMYDLAHMGRTARRRWPLLALCAALAFAAVFGWSSTRPEQFEASGVVVLPARDALLASGLDALDIDGALGASDELVILETGRSSDFRSAAARRAGQGDVPSRDELFVRQVQGPPGSRIEAGRPVARVTALADDPRTARALSRAASKLLADEASDAIHALAEAAPAPRRAAIRRAGAIVGTHADERRAGRSSRVLSAAAAAFIAFVIALFLLVVLSLRDRRSGAAPEGPAAAVAP